MPCHIEGLVGTLLSNDKVILQDYYIVFKFDCVIQSLPSLVALENEELQHRTSKHMHLFKDGIGCI